MRFEDARRHMVANQVRPNDVTDFAVQRAMETVPREIFLPAELRDQAYVERELVYAEARWMLRPRDFAKLVQALEVREGHLVLAAQGGSGYGAAILAHLCDMVVMTDAKADLVAQAQDNLNALGLQNAAAIEAEAGVGAPSQGPFDRILLAGVVETEPTALLDQLKDGGRLAAIVRRDGVSRGGVYVRAGDVYSFAPRFDAASQAVLAGFAAEKTFSF